ncbi:MAG: hypothetical protein ABJI62_07350, partial [Alphaproteobacteria bacterium]
MAGGLLLVDGGRHITWLWAAHQTAAAVDVTAPLSAPETLPTTEGLRRFPMADDRAPLDEMRFALNEIA